jgi:transcription elongation factor Elf1
VRSIVSPQTHDAFDPIRILSVPLGCELTSAGPHLSLLSPDLSDPIDVFSEWVDQSEKVNADVAKDQRRAGAGSDDEDEDALERRGEEED